MVALATVDNIRETADDTIKQQLKDYMQKACVFVCLFFYLFIFNWLNHALGFRPSKEQNGGS